MATNAQLTKLLDDICEGLRKDGLGVTRAQDVAVLRHASSGAIGWLDLFDAGDEIYQLLFGTVEPPKKARRLGTNLTGAKDDASQAIALIESDMGVRGGRPADEP